MESQENKSLICYSPFCQAEIDTKGDIHPCCPRYTNFYSFGNIYEQSFEEIWNSDKANNFRQKILNNDYSLCNRDICFEFKKKYITQDEKNNPSAITDCKHLRLAYDVTCNVACITCRDKIKKDRNKNKDDIINKIWSILPNIETIQMNNAGDIFASKHSRELVAKITSDFPHIKFHIDTNLTLCNEILYKKMGLDGKVLSVHCSIPGYSKKTYNKVVRVGNWKSVMKNLQFIVSEKNKGKIEEVTIIMVYHKYNYLEMPDMAKLASKLGINIVFSAYQPWQDASLSAKYDEIAVFNQNHKNFKDFLTVITNSAMYGDNIKVESQLEKLRANLKPWKYNLYNNLKLKLLNLL